MITFDDFKKLDLRIGKILSVEKIEGADKLLKLEVDFGEEKRQVVAGIAQYYEAEALIGKQCPFILNLEPRILRGVESNGMILAVGVGEAPILMHPDKDVPNGSVVR